MMLLLCVICMVLGGVFFLSRLRGGMIDSLLTWGLSVFLLEHLLRFGSSYLLKDPSPSGSKRSSPSIIEERPGSCSEEGGPPRCFIQIPFTCVQFMSSSASGSSPTFGKRSGSIVEDFSVCQDRPKELAPAGGHPGCLVHIPFSSVHCILAELVAF